MLIPDYVDSSWNEFINRKDIILLLSKIEGEIGTDFYPERKNVLRFLSVPLNEIKYIIVGMDPYPNCYIADGVEKPVATGRNFEIDNYGSWTNPTKNKSLINILKSIYSIDHENVFIKKIRDDIKNGNYKILSPNKLFDNLEKQGVLFLNSSFTVEKNKPGSHIDLWAPFFKELVIFIENKTSAKWLLFGHDALNKTSKFVDEQRIIKAAHPRTEKFVDDQVFLNCTDINWKGI